MQLIKVEAEYGMSAGPEYGAPKARAVIAYGFTTDENITAEAALNAAMGAAVSHVRSTLGLKNATAPAVATVAGVGTTDPQAAANPASETTEKPKRGRPAGTKNANPEVAPEKPATGTAAVGADGPQPGMSPTVPNTGTEVVPAAEAQPPVSPPTSAASQFSPGDVTKAASALAARLTKAGDKRTAREIVLGTFRKLMPENKTPLPPLSSVPENLRAAFIAELEKYPEVAV